MNATTVNFDAIAASLADAYRVFPVTPNAKSPPLLPKWQDKATTDKTRIAAWWTTWPTANVGIATGGGLLVLDVDGEAGAESLAKLGLLHGALPETAKIRTPSGGFHYYFTGPDVANSASKIAPGLDIRGVGGYVCAPGSVTDKGVYSVVCDSDPAPAPDWLLELCSAPRENKNTGEPIPDAAPDVVERARAWLEGQGGAIEGDGGDHRTFVVACSLRDMALSAGQAFELLSEWNSTKCAPSWTPEELQTKVANAYRYAENEAGARVALPEDFPVVVQDMASVAIDNAKGRKPRNFLTVADFASPQRANPGYVIKGILGRRSYAELFGAPGEGKTFVALDMAYAVAQGREWMGHKVRGGLVLYIPYEGGGGLGKRILALRQKYGDAPLFRVVENPDYNLREISGRVALGADMTAALGQDKPVLTVVDTFSRALMGGDENSATDVGAFNAAMGALIENTSTTVLLIHHSGKNRAAGARGSSALLAAIDTELEADNGQVVTRKQRDGADGEVIGFKLVPVPVGIDDDSEEIISCVVERAAATPKAEQLPQQAKEAMRALCEVSPSNDPVSEQTWQDAFERIAWPVDPPATDSRRKAFRRAVKALGDRVTSPKPGFWQRAMVGGEE